MPFKPLIQYVKMSRNKLGLRLAIGVFLSILAVEAIVLVPSYTNFQKDLLSRLEHVGRATAIAVLSLQAHSSDRDALINARVMAHNSNEIVGGALYDAEGTLIGTFGEATVLELAPNSAGLTQRLTADGSRLEVLWTSTETGLPFTVVGRLDAEWIADELVSFVWRILGLTLLISTIVCGATLLIFHRAASSSCVRAATICSRSPLASVSSFLAISSAAILSAVPRSMALNACKTSPSSSERSTAMM